MEIDGAIVNYEKAVDIMKNLFLKYHALTADYYVSLSSLYLEAGRYEDTIDAGMEAVRIYEDYAELFRDTSIIETTFFNIGFGHYKLEEYDEALNLYNNCRILRERRFTALMENLDRLYDPDYGELALLYNNIAAVYEEQGDYDKAAEYQLLAYSTLTLHDLEKQERIMERLRRIYERLAPQASFEEWIA